MPRWSHKCGVRSRSPNYWCRTIIISPILSWITAASSPMHNTKMHADTCINACTHAHRDTDAYADGMHSYVLHPSCMRHTNLQACATSAWRTRTRAAGSRHFPSRGLPWERGQHLTCKDALQWYDESHAVSVYSHNRHEMFRKLYFRSILNCCRSQAICT